jgi:hypothetical protein
MWRTQEGNRILEGAEWRVFREAMSTLWEEVEEVIDLDEPALIATGVKEFATLGPGQQLALLASVGTALSDRATKAPKLTWLNEATAAAVFDSMIRWVRLEIDLEDLGTHFRSLIVEVCHELAAEHNAAYGVPDPDPEAEEGTVWHYPPEAESKDDEAWESIVESLAERVLWDGDYAMSAEFIDLPPEAARAKARMLRIDPGYFRDIPPDPTDAELATIRGTLARLCGREVSA